MATINVNRVHILPFPANRPHTLHIAIDVCILYTYIHICLMPVPKPWIWRLAFFLVFCFSVVAIVEFIFVFIRVFISFSVVYSISIRHKVRTKIATVHVCILYSVYVYIWWSRLFNWNIEKYEPTKAKPFTITYTCYIYGFFVVSCCYDILLLFWWNWGRARLLAPTASTSLSTSINCNLLHLLFAVTYIQRNRWDFNLFHLQMIIYFFWHRNSCTIELKFVAEQWIGSTFPHFIRQNWRWTRFQFIFKQTPK